MRQALDAVDAFLLELDGDILVVLAEERNEAYKWYDEVSTAGKTAVMRHKRSGSWAPLMSRLRDAMA